MDVDGGGRRGQDGQSLSSYSRTPVGVSKRFTTVRVFTTYSGGGLEFGN